MRRGNPSPWVFSEAARPQGGRAEVGAERCPLVGAAPLREREVGGKRSLGGGAGQGARVAAGKTVSKS